SSALAFSRTTARTAASATGSRGLSGLCSSIASASLGTAGMASPKMARTVRAASLALVVVTMGSGRGLRAELLEEGAELRGRERVTGELQAIGQHAVLRRHASLDEGHEVT